MPEMVTCQIIPHRTSLDVSFFLMKRYIRQRARIENNKMDSSTSNDRPNEVFTIIGACELVTIVMKEKKALSIQHRSSITAH